MKRILIHIKKTILFFLFIFLFILIYSQNHPTPYYLTQQLYVNTDSNFLMSFGEKKYLEKFYDKLENLCLCADRNVTILHFGASHIQAGVWPWELRKKFEQLCPYSFGPPGLVFPFSVTNSNHPYFYRSEIIGNWEHSKITDKELKYPVGFSGITAITNDSVAQINIFFNQVAEIYKRKFDKVSIFCNISDTLSFSIKVNPSEDLDTVFFAKENLIVFKFKNQQDYLNINIQKKQNCDTAFMFFGAVLDKSEIGFRYISVGINGASTSSYLKAQFFDEQIKYFNPDLVIFSIGVNDAVSNEFSKEKYINNYQNLINKVRAQNPECAIIFSTNTDFFNKGQVNKKFLEVFSAMKELSQKNNCSIWPLFNVMGGEESILKWKNDELATKDKIHFTREGYTIIAKLMFNAILKDFEEYLHDKNRIKK